MSVPPIDSIFMCRIKCQGRHIESKKAGSEGLYNCHMVGICRAWYPKGLEEASASLDPDRGTMAEGGRQQDWGTHAQAPAVSDRAFGRPLPTCCCRPGPARALWEGQSVPRDHTSCSKAPVPCHLEFRSQRA
jgi:hypothetical protein